ncbi:hypothetical protein DPMN_000655 [Dreissena polymorpha]|uniref:Uncharacterized protein n=1 Tax=Dreissena polymorpha TaxID=45954 RepID=A0A9D4MIK6_DREPO|nr:hypothetical protein DPMN_000655 [Dreissena polymorpha]
MIRMKRQNRRSKQRCRTDNISERVMKKLSGRSKYESVGRLIIKLLSCPKSTETYLSKDRDVPTHSDTYAYPTRSYKQRKA